VADEANSELLNTGEASKPNETPSSPPCASDPVNLSLTTLALHHFCPALELLALNTAVGKSRDDERLWEGGRAGDSVLSYAFDIYLSSLVMNVYHTPFNILYHPPPTLQNGPTDP
jgi:hypothetical protein